MIGFDVKLERKLRSIRFGVSGLGRNMPQTVAAGYTTYLAVCVADISVPDPCMQCSCVRSWLNSSLVPLLLDCVQAPMRSSRVMI
ncbi:hypothetical protein IFM89_029214 [Coptis chinensis]|uniref:Uncharacterized protein n=1 Tax=Coptis chinensis TaxID=261450 RepID=A0A835IR19_9MAGN|nr:hypothetical protein IFM89_029214 [Coptis chinensis]